MAPGSEPKGTGCQNEEVSKRLFAVTSSLETYDVLTPGSRICYLKSCRAWVAHDLYSVMLAFPYMLSCVRESFAMIG